MRLKEKEIQLYHFYWEVIFVLTIFLPFFSFLWFFLNVFHFLNCCKTYWKLHPACLFTVQSEKSFKYIYIYIYTRKKIDTNADTDWCAAPDLRLVALSRLVPRSHTTLTVDLKAFLETPASLLGETRGRDGRVCLKADFIAVTCGGRVLMVISHTSEGQKSTQLWLDSLDPRLATAGTFRGSQTSVETKLTLQRPWPQPLNSWRRQLIEDQAFNRMQYSRLLYSKNDESSSDGQGGGGAWQDGAIRHIRRETEPTLRKKVQRAKWSKKSIKTSARAQKLL